VKRKRPAKGRRLPRPAEQPQVRREPVVAVVNTNDDLVMALRSRLLDEGYEIVMAHIRDIKTGRTDFSAFVSSHKPDAIVYDIAIPYEDNWTFLETLRKLPACRDTNFIITTVNKREMDKRVGKTDAVELVGGHADDFEPLVEQLHDVVGTRKRFTT
jgi:CheY-like chemotaxis protein